MKTDPNQFRFWRAVLSLDRKQIYRPWDFLVAFLMGTVGTYFYTAHVTDISNHLSVAGDYLAIIGALLGVVIAGFAIAAALLDEKFARAMRDHSISSYDVLRHFLIEGGILIGSLAASIVYRSIAVAVGGTNKTAEECLFGAATFLCFWGLFGALELMKLVLSVAVTGVSLHSVPEKKAS